MSEGSLSENDESIKYKWNNYIDSDISSDNDDNTGIHHNKTLKKDDDIQMSNIKQQRKINKNNKYMDSDTTDDDEGNIEIIYKDGSLNDNNISSNNENNTQQRKSDLNGEIDIIYHDIETNSNKKESIKKAEQAYMEYQINKKKPDFTNMVIDDDLYDDFNETKIQLFSVNVRISKTETKTLNTKCNKNTKISELKNIIFIELNIDFKDIEYMSSKRKKMWDHNILKDFNIINSNNLIALKYKIQTNSDTNLNISKDNVKTDSKLSKQNEKASLGKWSLFKLWNGLLWIIVGLSVAGIYSSTVQDTCKIVDLTQTRLCSYGCDCTRSCRGRGGGSSGRGSSGRGSSGGGSSGGGSSTSSYSGSSCTTTCKSICYRNVMDPYVILSKCGQTTFKEKIKDPCKSNTKYSNANSMTFECYVWNCNADTFTVGNSKNTMFVGIGLLVFGIIVAIPGKYYKKCIDKCFQCT